MTEHQFKIGETPLLLLLQNSLSLAQKDIISVTMGTTHLDRALLARD